MTATSDLIESAWENRSEISPESVGSDVKSAVEDSIAGLDSGELRVAERSESGEWMVHEWLKKAVLLYFRIHDNAPVDAGYTRFFDKVPLKYASYDADRFANSGTRVVPDALVRRGFEGDYRRLKALLESR